MPNNEIIGAQLSANFIGENGLVIDANEHPFLYENQILRTESVTIRSEDSFWTDIQDVLRGYINMATGLANLVGGEPSLGGVRDFFNGFRDAILRVDNGLSGVKKFVHKEMTVVIPYPHPSGLKKVILRSHGNCNGPKSVLPRFPNSGPPIPGVNQVNNTEFYNGGTKTDLDLEEIAQSDYWKAFFFNDGENDRLIPFTYSYRDGECAVLLGAKLKFVRYNFAPEIRTDIAGFPSPPYEKSQIFVHPHCKSVEQGYLPEGASKDVDDSRELEIVKWRNGSVSLNHNSIPARTLSLTALSRSTRIKWPDLGSRNFWGIEFSIDPPSSLPVPQQDTVFLDPPGQPNTEQGVKLIQPIPGEILEAGSSYPFKININDGDLYAAERKWILKVVDRQLKISSIAPLSIRRGGKVTLRGEFGFYEEREFGPPQSMLHSVLVGDEHVSWKRSFQQGVPVLIIGPITSGGPITLRFNDSSRVISKEAIQIHKPYAPRIRITEFEPLSAKAGQTIKIYGSNFRFGSGDAMRVAKFKVGGVVHEAKFLNSASVEVRIHDWTPSGLVTAELSGAIGIGAKRFIKKTGGRPPR